MRWVAEKTPLRLRVGDLLDTEVVMSHQHEWTAKALDKDEAYAVCYECTLSINSADIERYMNAVEKIVEIANKPLPPSYERDEAVDRFAELQELLDDLTDFR